MLSVFKGDMGLVGPRPTHYLIDTSLIKLRTKIKNSSFGNLELLDGLKLTGEINLDIKDKKSKIGMSFYLSKRSTMLGAVY